MAGELLDVLNGLMSPTTWPQVYTPRAPNRNPRHPPIEPPAAPGAASRPSPSLPPLRETRLSPGSPNPPAPAEAPCFFFVRNAARGCARL